MQSNPNLLTMGCYRQTQAGFSTLQESAVPHFADFTEWPAMLPMREQVNTNINTGFLGPLSLFLRLLAPKPLFLDYGSHRQTQKEKLAANSISSLSSSIGVYVQV